MHKLIALAAIGGGTLVALAITPQQYVTMTPLGGERLRKHLFNTDSRRPDLACSV
jgi:hypothetical protein